MTEIPEGTIIETDQVEAGMRVRLEAIYPGAPDSVVVRTITTYEGFVVGQDETGMMLSTSLAGTGSPCPFGPVNMIELLAEKTAPSPGYYVVEYPTSGLTGVAYFDGIGWLLAEGGHPDPEQDYTIIRRLTQEA